MSGTVYMQSINFGSLDRVYVMLAEFLIELKLNEDEHLVTNSGNPVVAHMDTIVQSIIIGDSQADVLFVARLATILLNAHVQ